MGKTFVIGDIHGGLRALKQVLERAQVYPEDQLIFLGDYVDGWSESADVLDFLIELNSRQSCVFMQGNHEEMVLKWLKSEDDNDLWRFHGGQSTVDAYAHVSKNRKISHIQFLDSLREHYLDDKNRLFVHAGFTNMKGVDFEFFHPLFWWDRSLWETAMATDNRLEKENILYPKRLRLYSEIFIGHTPTLYFQETEPMNAQNVWNIDTGAAFTGRLTIMDVDTKEFWQSDPLPELYPGERGRN